MQKLLPPHLFLIALVSMIALHVAQPEPRWAGDTQLLAGLAFAAVFLALAFIGAAQFRRHRTNIHTFRKPDTLVTSGLFRWTRNPMYLGFAGALAGAAIAMNCVSGLVITLLYVLIADRWYIRFEERTMAETFGPAYAEYRAKTRRWI
ncbi:Isoprenylcysteine carboxyl methyltransferase [Parvibaculum lavamentivorans DS-1]|uniref:Isoprenylcysteine carboxyl methyltransferase n=1 Tax=Parvibaculum lavamentivorans (strain DS-1 / DSM 13023 / NCIMB 13966) TaxID=402881 RepID=A7HZ29_PARL1|nr:isoprenylcysteine carboxylmethyltransferase family protein [Parvibaculum lavamentivorans]ABS65162.1 Isoprenylcysteine carboxyl methyltransferase [Parvibaculum lavamentivorans DS-1]